MSIVRTCQKCAPPKERDTHPDDVIYHPDIVCFKRLLMWSFVYQNISIIKLPLAIVRILVG
jgi:hypothetical protein